MTYNKDKIWQYLLVGMTLFTTLFYALITNHIWEDFFITFKFSKNLVDGYGLVYHSGEYVHGFTSVINTLLPAFFYWVTGKSFVVTLWLYKLASISALIFGIWFFIKEYKKIHDDSFLVIIFFSIVFAFEAKVIMFTTNGQEAGFMALFLLPSVIYAFQGYSKNWAWAGICWAGLMYTRPDGFVYIFILAVSAVIFGRTKNKQELIALFKSALLCTAIYLPWFIFVWGYYGTPVPHTIVAKAGLGTSIFNDVFYTVKFLFSTLPLVAASIFQPSYYHFGGWPQWITIYANIAWVICMFYWLLPIHDRFGRFVSIIFSLLVIYLTLAAFRGSVYPWYFPPAATLGLFVLISAIYNLSKNISVKYSKIYMYALSLIVVYISTTVYFMTVSQIKVQQEVVEFGNRAQIGHWLNKNKKVGDSVFLESLGYIGYFSNAKMLDWPGLVSPEVVAIKTKKEPFIYEPFLKELQPDWLVVRPIAYNILEKSSVFKENYKVVKVFNVSNEVLRYPNLPGKNYLLKDSVYAIAKKLSK